MFSSNMRKIICRISSIFQLIQISAMFKSMYNESFHSELSVEAFSRVCDITNTCKRFNYRLGNRFTQRCVTFTRFDSHVVFWKLITCFTCTWKANKYLKVRFWRNINNICFLLISWKLVQYIQMIWDTFSLDNFLETKVTLCFAAQYEIYIRRWETFSVVLYISIDSLYWTDNEIEELSLIIHYLLLANSVVCMYHVDKNVFSGCWCVEFPTICTDVVRYSTHVYRYTLLT